MDLNKVILIGRLTSEIELKSTNSGTQYCQFNLAVGNGKDKDGNERETDFITCVAWNKGAENLSVYVHKGHRLAIEGRLKYDKYQNDKGENRYKAYVRVETFEFLESKSKNNFIPSEPETNIQQKENEDPYANFGNQITIDDLDRTSLVSDDDLPF